MFATNVTIHGERVKAAALFHFGLNKKTIMETWSNLNQALVCLDEGRPTNKGFDFVDFCEGALKISLDEPKQTDNKTNIGNILDEMNLTINIISTKDTQNNLTTDSLIDQLMNAQQ